MKKTLYIMLVALLTAVGTAWGQTNRTLGNIPEGWTVTIGETTVPVVNGTATIPAGANVVLTPTYPDRVKSVTLVDAPACRLIRLDTVQHNLVAQDCDTLTDTLKANVKISIAAGATVTLDGVTINGTNNGSYKWAGITCEGDATVILKDGSTNSVKGFHRHYPGINVPKGKTLTIKGTGSLTASSNGWGAGIGAGWGIECGNIIIESGIIIATGGDNGGAGIGSANNSKCGTVEIKGGIVTALGGENAAGIGSGDDNNFASSCGNITISGGTVIANGGSCAAGIGSGKGSTSICSSIEITSGVTSVTATKGQYSPNSIGAGLNGSCGTVTIGGTVYYDGTDYVGTGSTYLTQSPLVYPTPAPSAPTGAINGKFTINSSGDQVYFSQGNLKYNGNNSWSFHTNQYDRVRTTEGYFMNYPMDLFCWGNVANPALNGTSYVDGANDLSVGSGTDWGANTIYSGSTATTGWRTLTSSEWTWLLGSYDWGATPTPGTNCRTSSTVNGVANARFAKAYLDTNSDGNGDVHGIIIFPDSYTHPDGVAAPTGINAVGSTSWNANKYNATDWGKMQTAGAVFLPAAGSRLEDYVDYVSANRAIGEYWSSTSDESYFEWESDTHKAYNLSFGDGDMSPCDGTDFRGYGFSVRLVKDVQ